MHRVPSPGLVWARVAARYFCWGKEGSSPGTLRLHCRIPKHSPLSNHPWLQEKGGVGEGTEATGKKRGLG